MKSAWRSLIFISILCRHHRSGTTRANTPLQHRVKDSARHVACVLWITRSAAGTDAMWTATHTHTHTCTLCDKYHLQRPLMFSDPCTHFLTLAYSSNSVCIVKHTVISACHWLTLITWGIHSHLNHDSMMANTYLTTYEPPHWSSITWRIVIERKTNANRWRLLHHHCARCRSMNTTFLTYVGSHLWKSQ